MLEDKIELVDRDYENCRVEKAPRQIKTRKFSFSSILDKFTQFRIRRLEKKLDQMKNDALTEGYTETNFIKKIEKKATAIAKLEEKIMVLSKEDVPANYVKRRAIKLKKKMSDNLSFNAGSLYSIGIENKEEIFANADEEVLEPELSEEERKIQEEISQNVQNIMNQEKEEELDSSVSAEEVRDAVEESFEKLDEEHQEKHDAESISSDEVRDVVEGAFSDLDKENPEHLEKHVSTDDVRDAVEETFERLDSENVVAPVETPISGEEVREVVEETFDELESDKDSKSIDVSKEVSRDDVRDAINNAFNAIETKDGSIPEITDPFVDVQTEEKETPQATSEVRLTKEEIEAAINEVIDRIKVSKNNGTSVKFDKFEEDGSVRQHKDDYVYTPMTDEEIRASQEKLGFDEHGNLIESQTKTVEPETKPVEEFVYTPMTDEEIRASQEKLGFDEHGNLVNPPKADYDIVATAKVVNDERSPLYSEETGVLKETLEETHERTATTVEKGIEYDLDKVENGDSVDTLEEFSVDGDKETHTDESEFIPADVSTPKEGVSAKIEDYSALKDKILYLRQQQLLTQEKKAAAQKAAEEAAALAQKAREEYEASQQSVSQSMEMLRAYSEALEEDCERNERSAEVAENDARMNKNFISMQKEKVDANNKLIDEIDSLIGPRAVPESIKLR